MAVFRDFSGTYETELTSRNATSRSSSMSRNHSCTNAKLEFAALTWPNSAIGAVLAALNLTLAYGVSYAVDPFRRRILLAS